MIIVVGVLTALGAEQGVEWLHWRHQVRETEERLLPEVQRNLLDLAERVVQRPCLAQRTVELRDALLQSNGRWQANADRVSTLAGSNVAKPNPSLAEVADDVRRLSGRPMPEVYEDTVRPWRDTVFQSALVAGVFNQMPPERAAVYASIYRATTEIRERTASERSAKARLSALAFDGVLSPAERADYLNDLGQLDADAAGMAEVSAQQLIAADKAGLRPKRSAFEKRFPPTSRFAACRATLSIPLAQN